MYLEDKYTIAGLQFHIKFPVGVCKVMQHAGLGISIASDQNRKNKKTEVVLIVQWKRFCSNRILFSALGFTAPQDFHLLGVCEMDTHILH